MIRIHLVEDHLLMRKGLLTSLERVDDLCVAGETDSGKAALSTLLSPPGQTSRRGGHGHRSSGPFEA